MKRYGKKRVPNCACTHSFTCKECLKNAPSYFYTPDNTARAPNQGVKPKGNR